MWEPRTKYRFVGQYGETLQTSLRRLLADGEVSGYVVSDLTQAEAAQGICGWCAKEPQQLIGLEFTNKTGMGARTRLVMGSLCLPLCADCSTQLTNALKATVR